MFVFSALDSVRFASGLLHFLWLACIPVLLWGLVMRVLPMRAVRCRYGLSIACLLGMTAMAGVAYRISDTSGDRLASAMQDGRTELEEANAFAETGGVGMRPKSLHDEGPDQRARGDAAEAEPIASTDSSGDGKAALASIAKAKASELWAKAITFAYFVGVLCYISRLIIGSVATSRLLGRSRVITEPAVQQLAVRVAERLRLRAVPLVLWCEQTAVPAVVGVVRPAILLPAAYANGVSVEQLEHVLLHEFSHLKRFDTIVNFLQNAIEAILFFHPLIWWMSSQVRLYRELCCDAAVVESGVQPQRYAGTLIDVAKWSRNRAESMGRGITPVGVAAFSSRAQLRLRLQRLMGDKREADQRPRRLMDAATLVAVVAVMAVLLSAERSNSKGRDTSPLQATPALAQETRLQMPKNIEPTELAGVVVDSDGEPIAGVTVDAWSWHAGDETTTDKNGVFRFRPESDNGRRRVEVRWMKEGYSPHYVPQQEVGVEGMVITLDSSTYIEGMVKGVNGMPAEGVVVRGEQRNIQGPGVRISEVATETTTDERGQYRLYVFPDEYVITVASAAGVARIDNVRLTPGRKMEQNIDLAPGVRFEAIVKDIDDGEPFSGLVLFNWRHKQFQGISDNTGRIVIDTMPPGEFEFYVGAGDKIERAGMTYYAHGPLGRWWSPDAKHEWQRRSVEPGKFQRNFDRLTFELQTGMDPVQIFVERGVEFSGRVEDPNGNPVEGATVAPAKTGSGNSLTGDTRYSVQTETDGSYRSVMPAGNDVPYNLIAFDGEYDKWRQWGSTVSEPISTKPGQQVKDIDFTLSRGATVRGKVITGANPDVPRPKVRAHAADLRGNRYYDPTAEINADGIFELRGIRPGKHFIQVEPFWLSAADAPHESTAVVDLQDGEVREGIEMRAVQQQPAVAHPQLDQAFDIPSPAEVKPIGPAAGGAIFAAQDKIFSLPCFDDTSMYFGACDGNFYCLDKTTGVLRWKHEDLLRVDSSPVVNQGIVYFTNAHGFLYALHSDSGKLAWKTKIVGSGYQDPVIYGRRLLISGTNRVAAVDLVSGNVVHSYPFEGDGYDVAITEQFITVVVNRDLEADNYTGKGDLLCFKPDADQPHWKIPLGGSCLGQIACDDQRCYVGTRDGQFNAVNLSDGSIAWSMNCADLFVDPKPVLADRVWADQSVLLKGPNVVFIASLNHMRAPSAIVAVNRSTGAKRWSLTNAVAMGREMVVSGDSLFAVSEDLKLIRIEAGSGVLQHVGLLPQEAGGEFAGVRVDSGHTYLVGGGKQVWRFAVDAL